MNDDGSPETVLEAWLLEMGLGFAFAITSGEELTPEQIETLSESTPNPQQNEAHNWLLEELQSHAESNSEG